MTRTDIHSMPPVCLQTRRGLRSARCRIVGILAIGLIAGADASRAGDAETAIVVEGERLASNPRHFRWTVTNHGDTPILAFQAPRYLGEEFLAPPNWQGEILVGKGSGKDDVRFTAGNPYHAILPGASKSFEIHDRRLRGTKRRLAVQVELAGGNVVTIADVWCPAPENVFEKNLPLIGLGGMFAVFLLVQVWRKRRKPTDAPHSILADAMRVERVTAGR
jgi:hypothetical protein